MYVSIEVPDITEYSKGFPRYWLNVIFIGSISTSYQVNALATTFVRLVEAALAEYRLAVPNLKEFWNTHTAVNLGAMHRAISHFESCLSDMHRAINCFTRLRRHKELPKGLQSTLNEERPRFVADQVSDQLREMRNAIHHLEDRLVDGSIQPDEPFILKPDGPETPHASESNQTIKTIDRLILGRQELLLSDVAAWLVEMARFAERIANYDARIQSEH